MTDELKKDIIYHTDGPVYDQTTKKTVEIRPGWVTAQFAKYFFGNDSPINQRKMVVQVDSSDGYISPFRFILTEEMANALQRFDQLAVQKNFQYQGSWQTLGPLIALADDIDKLARLEGAWKSGALVTWKPDKQREMCFDLIIRSFQILAWMDTHFQDDDIDDRQPRPEQVS